MRELLVGYWLRKRRSERDERIGRLEQWHSIYDEWFERTGNPEYAVEMANQGLTFFGKLLKDLYLPAVMEQLNQKSLLCL